MRTRLLLSALTAATALSLFGDSQISLEETGLGRMKSGFGTAKAGKSIDADNMNFDTLILVRKGGKVNIRSGNGTTYPNHAGYPVQEDHNGCAPRMLCFSETRLAG